MIPTDDVHAWCFDLADSGWDRFRSLLSSHEIAESMRKRRTHLQEASARCRSIVRLILSRYTERAPEGLQFEFTEFGKPMLVDTACEFNISHSGRWGALAIAAQAIGVDIESIDDPRTDINEVVELICHPEEREIVDRLLAADRKHYLFALWARKEAYVKATGVGMQSDLRKISVLQTRIRDESAPESKPYHVHNLTLINGYAAAVCTAADQPRIHTLRVNSNDVSWDDHRVRVKFHRCAPQLVRTFAQTTPTILR